jgi:PEGA domain
MRSIFSLLIVSVLLPAAMAQNSASGASKARVFITDSQSWEVSGSGGGANGAGSSHSSGGARPQTAEIIKTFGDRCPQVVVNNKQDKADYVVLLDHEGGKSIIVHDTKIAVFNSDGDSIVSHSTRSVGTAVKDACDAISGDWPARMNKISAQKQGAQLMAVSDKSVQPVAAGSQISVTSTPGGADIEVDGNFVGNTPSAIDVTPGDHTVVVKKSGYKDWQRKMKVTGGSINVSAEMEKAQ